MPKYEYRPFEYHRPAGLDKPEPRWPVAIVGAGPIGLAMAVDLAQRGIKSVVLDDKNVISIGSRAICWAKRTLEIFNRLGVGQRMLDKGVTWKVGRLFHGDEEVYNFDLLPEDGHKYPAFINLQQYYIEQYLVERAQDFPDLIELRFKNEVVDHHVKSDHVVLDIKTPDGDYQLDADYYLACDGAGSPTRKRMKLAFDGQTFDEHFLIADVKMDESPFETNEPERWFWFEPKFHPGQSALLHKQPDNIYRIDLQLGSETDLMTEATEEKVFPRIKAMVGDKPFKLDWMSVYKFRCAKLENFVHSRVIFVGDSAHVVSPFGARGGNGGIQDVDNLGWKLAEVLNGSANIKLLKSYNEERGHASAENIMHSSRATNFMTPKSPIEHQFRTEVLSLAKTMSFARKLINSGRLSMPCSLSKSSLQTDGPCRIQSGSALIDAPLRNNQWLIDKIPNNLTLLGFGDVDISKVDGVSRVGIGTDNKDYPCYLPEGSHAFDRYGENALYLIRPDGHVAASFDKMDKNLIAKAVDKVFALAQNTKVEYATA